MTPLQQAWKRVWAARAASLRPGEGREFESAMFDLVAAATNEGRASALAAFTPAEPPQQERELLRAPANRASTVADPRDGLIARIERLRVKGNTSEGQGINDTVDRVIDIIEGGS